MPRLLLTLSALLLCVVALTAQRRITPTEPVPTVTAPAAVDDEEAARRARLAQQRRLKEVVDINGNVVLVDTLTGLEYVDTVGVTKIPKMQYPLWQSVVVEADLFDAAMRLFGQRYGIASVGASLSLHNRYFPTLEVGLGQCTDTPEGGNYTYRSPLSPFFRIGADYNFLYNNSPRYQLLAGVRYGLSPYTFSVTDILVDDGYWRDPVSATIPRQSVVTGYVDIMLRIRVSLTGPLSLGWAFKFHSILHESGSLGHGKPMYIPGYGSRDSSISAALFLSYTFSLNRQSPPLVDTINTQ